VHCVCGKKAKKVQKRAAKVQATMKKISGSSGSSARSCRRWHAGVYGRALRWTSSWRSKQEAKYFRLKPEAVLRKVLLKTLVLKAGISRAATAGMREAGVVCGGAY
jgi:hypothetical protein